MKTWGGGWDSEGQTTAAGGRALMRTKDLSNCIKGGSLELKNLDNVTLSSADGSETNQERLCYFQGCLESDLSFS